MMQQNSADVSLEMVNRGPNYGQDPLANPQVYSTNVTYNSNNSHQPISDPSLLPKVKSDIPGACSNLVNSIVGAGIIGIPFAFQQSGLVSGVVLLILVGVLTDKTLRMIVELASCSPQLKGRGVWAYDDLMHLAFGRKGRWFVLVSMFVAAYGAMVAYLLIIKDTLPVVWGIVLDGDNSVGSFWEREFVMLLTSLLIVVPLSMQRDFSALSCTSGVSVACDLLLVAFVAKAAPIGESLADAGGFGTVLTQSIVHKGFFIGFGVLTVAMCCQHSAFIVASSLQNPTPKRWSFVTISSLSISTICCLILGITGYLGFLEETQGDVLNNFPIGRASNAARSLLAITMFFTYPMEAFVARHVLVQLIWKGDMDGYVLETQTATTTTQIAGAADDDGSTVPGSLAATTVAAATTTQKRVSSKIAGCLNRRHQVTLLIYLLTLMPALIVDDLGPVLSITGAIGGCCLAYIGPGLAYLGIHGEDFLRRLAGAIEALNRGSGGNDNAATTTHATVTVTDLPLDGDAEASKAGSGTDHYHGDRVFSPERLFVGRAQPHTGLPGLPEWKSHKIPWWWYPLGMPIWIRVALEGSRGVTNRLASMASQRRGEPISMVEAFAGLSRAHGNHPDHNNNNNNSTMTTEVIVEPCLFDYGSSIFFVVFGAIAMIAGVASNLYVQIHGIFAFGA